MIKVFFRIKEGEVQSVDLSLNAYRLLDSRARSLNMGLTDILREVLQFFGQVTEFDVLNYLNTSALSN
jgi:hypothetical protein